MQGVKLVRAHNPTVLSIRVQTRLDPEFLAVRTPGVLIGVVREVFPMNGGGLVPYKPRLRGIVRTSPSQWSITA